MAAVKKGVLRGSSSSVASTSKSDKSNKSDKPDDSGSSAKEDTATAEPAGASAAEIDRSDVPTGADSRWLKYVEFQIKKYDKDKNGRLTADEWSASNGDFGAVDKNGDGSISLGEYYLFKKK